MFHRPHFLVVQLKDDILDLLSAGTLMIASRQGEPPNVPSTDADLEAITGLQVWNPHKINFTTISNKGVPHPKSCLL